MKYRTNARILRHLVLLGKVDSRDAKAACVQKTYVRWFFVGGDLTARSGASSVSWKRFDS